MTTEYLSRDRWTEVGHTLIGGCINHLHPQSRIVVSRDATGSIVGTLVLTPIWHVEGAWIAPTHRGRVSVLRGLRRAMLALVACEGIREVWMMATNRESRRLCERAGEHVTHLACDHFAVQIQ